MDVAFLNADDVFCGVNDLEVVVEEEVEEEEEVEGVLMVKSMGGAR